MRAVQGDRATENPANAVKTIGSLHPISNIRVKAIEVIGERRPLNRDKVRAIAASMELVGLQTQITVRKQRKKVILVSGWHRLEAAKLLGWSEIPSIVVLRDKVPTRIWQIVENLYRAELTALERAECVEELRQLVQQPQVGQVAPPGGRQPKDQGINKTAKVLGLTKEEIRRSKVIGGICRKAKGKVRKLGLDNNQQALLEIAEQPTPKAQLRAVREIVARKHAARDRNTAATDKKTTAEIDALDADIRQKEDALERLKRDLASDRRRRRDLDDKLAVQGKPENASRNATTGDEDRSPERTPARVVEEEEQGQVPSPSTVPTGNEDIPAFLDRRPLSPEDQVTFDTIWGALQTASAVVRERIRVALNTDINFSNSAAE
jgi:hypothetical protein